MTTLDIIGESVRHSRTQPPIISPPETYYQIMQVEVDAAVFDDLIARAETHCYPSNSIAVTRTLTRAVYEDLERRGYWYIAGEDWQMLAAKRSQ